MNNKKRKSLKAMKTNFQMNENNLFRNIVNMPKNFTLNSILSPKLKSKSIQQKNKENQFKSPTRKKRSILIQKQKIDKFKSLQKTNSSKKQQKYFDKKFSSIAFDFQKDKENKTQKQLKVFLFGKHNKKQKAIQKFSKDKFQLDLQLIYQQYQIRKKQMQKAQKKLNFMQNFMQKFLSQKKQKNFSIPAKF